ncbi:MAG: hypothetical protein K2K45_05145 [Muribaculaceae bacterium]|nr:hypothetical protein [Muribaculaceae bacterium]
MKEKKDSKAAKTAGKVTMKAGKIIRAYRLLNIERTEKKEGFKLSALEANDLYIVIRALDALKPVVDKFDGFVKDAQKKLKPEGWDEKVQKYQDASTEEKAEIDKEAEEYTRKVNECVSTELEKDKEIEAYEHLSEEAFGKLVQTNDHLLNVPEIMLLREILA